MFIKVYTDKANSKRSTGRPSYSHLLCYAKPKLTTDPVDVAYERLLSKTQARKERSRQNRNKRVAGGETETENEKADINADGNYNTPYFAIIFKPTFLTLTFAPSIAHQQVYL